MKLIIVDNETVRQRNLRSILSSLGYKSADVEGTDDAAIGLNTIKKKRFDCAFISLAMPKMDGIEVLKQIRENMRLKSLPVIIYGAQASREDVIAAVQAGANGFLGYPFSVSDVEDVIRKVIKMQKNSSPS